MKKIIKYFLFILYIVLMIYLLLIKREVDYEAGYNLIPFYSFKMFFPLLTSEYSGYRYLAISNLFGNIILFIPLGIFLPLIFEKQNKFFLFLLTATIIPIIVEFIQFFTKLGTADIDDVILNVFGSLIGYSIFKIFWGGKK